MAVDTVAPASTNVSLLPDRWAMTPPWTDVTISQVIIRQEGPRR
jgi:hypothetical protein